MGILRELPPTAGFPINFKDITRAIFHKNGKSLDEGFKSYLCAPFAQITYSGTAAFYFILETLKKISKKRSVKQGWKARNGSVIPIDQEDEV